MTQRQPRSTLFPYTTLFRSLSIAATTISVAVMIVTLAFTNGFQETVSQKIFSFWGHVRVQYKQPMKSTIAEEEQIDRKSTRLNSSHTVISYAVFCLKKKKTN